jgi:hypothetical protein
MDEDEVERWLFVLEEQKRREEYERRYQRALRRFNTGALAIDGMLFKAGDRP